MSSRSARGDTITYFWVHLHQSSKITKLLWSRKKSKKLKRSRFFSQLFCLLMERSASERPKNLRILIRNTVCDASKHVPVQSFFHRNGWPFVIKVCLWVLLSKIWTFCKVLLPFLGCVVYGAHWSRRGRNGMFFTLLCDIPILKSEH